MDEFVSYFLKFMSHTIVVQIYSFPHFSIEVLLSGIMCVVYCLLIFEVNDMVYKNEMFSKAKLRIRFPMKDMEGSSIHSVIIREPLRKMESKIYTFKKEKRKLSNTSGIAIVSPNEVLQSLDNRHCYDRIEQILSITPSEYIRKEKEKRGKKHGIQTCIHSLTSLLETSLKNELGLGRFSKENLRKNMYVLRDYEKHILPLNCTPGDFEVQSFPSLSTTVSSDKRTSAYNKYPFSYLNIMKDQAEQDCKEGESDYHNKEKTKLLSEFEQLCNENTISIIPCGLGDSSLPILAT